MPFRYYYCTAALFENKAVFARFCVSGEEARSRRFWLHSATGNFSAMWRSNRFVKIAFLYEIDRPLLAAARRRLASYDCTWRMSSGGVPCLAYICLLLHACGHTSLWTEAACETLLDQN